MQRSEPSNVVASLFLQHPVCLNNDDNDATYLQLYQVEWQKADDVEYEAA